MSIILFGANNPTGAAFLRLTNEVPVSTWGRKASIYDHIPHVFCDLSATLPISNRNPIQGVLVSFAPVWHLASFLEKIASEQPDLLTDLVGVVACSSSSFLTKRFAFNDHDRQLADLLTKAHLSLSMTCINLGIPLQILAPTLIYGAVDFFSDKNISKIIALMRRFPIIFMPANSGLRQPIHASQLASVAKHQALKMSNDEWPDCEPSILPLGGDEVLSYEKMILRARNELDRSDSAKRCRILTVPNKFFFLVATPLILLDLRYYESILRINSNLSGFARVHEIIGSEYQHFPVLPLAIGG